jgi:hypothetical protein
MGPVLGQGFGTALEHDPEGNWYVVPACSGQSFEILEALNLESSDFVPKLTRCETTWAGERDVKHFSSWNREKFTGLCSIRYGTG